MKSLKRKRHKEVKQTSVAVERCGVKPKGEYMDEIADRRQERSRLHAETLTVVREAGKRRLTDDEAELLASVFVTERLAFQYFEDHQYPWAVRQLARQGHPKLADIVKRAFM